jgi:hypothetical protein
MVDARVTLDNRETLHRIIVGELCLLCAACVCVCGGAGGAGDLVH